MGHVNNNGNANTDNAGNPWNGVRPDLIKTVYAETECFRSSEAYQNKFYSSSQEEKKSMDERSISNNERVDLL